MLKLQKYQFSVRYKKEKELYVADTLSRPPVADYFSAANAKQKYEVFQVEIAKMDIKPNRVTSETIQQIKQETKIRSCKRTSQPLREFSKRKKVFVKPRPGNKHQP